jgi:serpin B
MKENPLIAADTRFAFKLFDALTQQERERNIFISPTSVALALLMAYNGAHGETQRAMAAALELDGMSLDDINRVGADLMQALEQLDPQVRLAIANSLWIRKGIDFDHSFMHRLQELYHAEAIELDFAAPASVQRINTWVNERTNDKISSILDQLDRLAVLVLINAIYFKGNWTSAFDKAKTTDHPFTLPSGQKKTVPMMRRAGEWRYYWDSALAAVSIPYGSGRLTMDVFLPEERGGLQAFYQLLSGTNWQIWTHQFRKAEGTVMLPRFKLEYEIKLNAALSALGMEMAFDRRRADFSAMCRSEQISISQVKHKTFVDVNEEGTEAAAVTAVEFRALGMIAHDRRFTFIVDRPFFFAIRDTRTGAILFMGSIVDP